MASCIGLDLGTTTISAIAIDCDTGAILETRNIPNGSDMAADVPGASLQDPQRILQRAREVLQELKGRHAPVRSIGIDGQMHGVLLVDALGRAVSPLYTWQDGRGDLPCGASSYAAQLSEASGYEMSSGFGMTTLYYLARNGQMPAGAAKLCSIFDYVGMQLTGRREPLMHASGAASFGLFDLKNLRWDRAAIEGCGIDGALLPELSAGCALLGATADGIPVACGIGDNQASYIGSVRDMEDSVLVNVGTGGQVSMMGRADGALLDLELRPLCGDRYILAGSTLCAGRAYALLESFIRGCAALTGYAGPRLYEQMNRLADAALEDGDAWIVDTRFCGTRRQEKLRGSFQGIGAQNFDPAHLISGVLNGIAEEMYALFQEMMALGRPAPAQLVGSGNGLRKNRALQRAFERRFGLKMQIPCHREEAAYGAALYGMVAAGLKGSLAETQRLIRYEGGRTEG